MRDKRQETDQQLKTAVFLLESKKFDEATEVLENVQKTVVFDPRVHSLLEAAKQKSVPADLGQTIAGIAGVTKEQEYVLQTPGGPAVAPPEKEGVVAKAQATPAVESTPKAPPLPVAPPPEKKEETRAAPVPEPVAPPKPAVPPPAPPAAKPPVEVPEKKKKGKPAVEEPPAKV